MSSSAQKKKTVNALAMIKRQRFRSREHTDEEIMSFVKAYTHEEIPEYQMSAFLMAVCFQGLSGRETAALTKATVESGVRVQWDNNPKYLVDKHSTGGVGDKISLILAPLVAHFGVSVPMMAGRGLGHTGGTIDKLESIPGFRTNFSVEEFQKLVREEGCCITAAGPELCPADRKLYALRDVTCTVSSIPLVTASIMGKKIAENPNSLVLDVKYGNGAFNENLEVAMKLAASMIATGEGNDVPSTAFLTRMDTPIGNTVGNWLEVKECIKVMQGNLKAQRLSHDLIILVVVQAAQMILQSGKYDKGFDELVDMVYEALDKGEIIEKFKKMVKAQGGDVSVIDNVDSVFPPPFSYEYKASSEGFVTSIDALSIGELGVQIGAGRKKTTDSVDMLAGIEFLKKVGDKVVPGDIIAKYQSSGQEADLIPSEVENVLAESIVIGGTKPDTVKLITHKVDKNGSLEMDLPSILVKLGEV